MNNKSTRSFDTVFVLMIFCLFAVSSLFLVLIGANVYHGILGRMEATSQTRSSLSYVANKVRSADSRDINIEKIDGQETLVIQSAINKTDYKTYIYLHDGYLMELFTKAENGFKEAEGERITKVSAFTMTKTESELSLEVSGSDCRKLTLMLSLS